MVQTQFHHPERNDFFVFHDSFGRWLFLVRQASCTATQTASTATYGKNSASTFLVLHKPKSLRTGQAVGTGLAVNGFSNVKDVPVTNEIS